MPFMRNGKRDYKREDKLYEAKPEVVKRRVARNAARAQLMKEGKVHKGDGKQVDHIVPLDQGGGKGRGNLRVTSAAQNESFKRDRNSNVVSQTSTKEAKKR